MSHRRQCRISALLLALVVSCSPVPLEGATASLRSATPPDGLESGRATLPNTSGTLDRTFVELLETEQPKRLEGTSYPTVSRVGAPGATKGTISCGAVRCNASTEECDWSQTGWACAPTALPTEATSYDATRPHVVRCDDGSDCGTSERCCVHADDRSGDGHQCMPRTEVNLCVREICLDGGAACPHGTRCDFANEYNPTSPLVEGACRAPEGPATCSREVRCPQSAPVCHVSDVAACKGIDDEAIRYVGSLRYRCTKQSDCGGEESCMLFPGSESSFCGRWRRDSPYSLVCDPRGEAARVPTAAELGRVCGADVACRKSLRCHPIRPTEEEGRPEGRKLPLPWFGVFQVEDR
jgi:hypothetical protein